LFCRYSGSLLLMRVLRKLSRTFILILILYLDLDLPPLALGQSVKKGSGAVLWTYNIN